MSLTRLSEAGPQPYLPARRKGFGTLRTIVLGVQDYRKTKQTFSEGAELVRPFAGHIISVSGLAIKSVLSRYV